MHLRKRAIAYININVCSHITTNYKGYSQTWPLPISLLFYIIYIDQEPKHWNLWRFDKTSNFVPIFKSTIFRTTRFQHHQPVSREPGGVSLALSKQQSSSLLSNYSANHIDLTVVSGLFSGAELKWHMYLKWWLYIVASFEKGKIVKNSCFQ